jgi:predicted transposase/invertase (TIGR01784 family)
MTMTPHDSLFKETFKDPRRAAEELRHVLAPELARNIDFTTLAVEPGEFVDEELRERHTDLLFSAVIAGTKIRIYVLFEHQSSVDPWLPLRLLSYMLRIWEEVRKQQPESRTLPAIVRSCSTTATRAGGPRRASRRCSSCPRRRPRRCSSTCRNSASRSTI